MSTCSCGKKSIKGSEYGGSVYGGNSIKGGGTGSKKSKEIVKSSNLSDISSLNEYQEMAYTLGGLGHQFSLNTNNPNN